MILRGGVTQALWSPHLPQIILDAGHGTMGLNVRPTGFMHCFVPILFFPPIWNHSVYPVPVYVGSV